MRQKNGQRINRMDLKVKEIKPGRSICVRSAAAAVLTWVGVLSLGCSKEPAEKEPVVTVQVAAARRAKIQKVFTAEAVLFPFQQAALTPKISAPVREFFVQRGSRVHRGQLLAILENRDLEAAKNENQGALQQAEATYTSAISQSIPEDMQKAELEAQQAKQQLEIQQKIYTDRENLYRQGALPRKEMNQAALALTQARGQFDIASKHLGALQATGKQQQLKAAAGQLASAKGKFQGSSAALSYSEIRSPIDGVVTERPFYPGEMANAGTALMTVMDSSRVIARAHIPEEEAALLKTGAVATLAAPGIDEGIPGNVTLVSPALDPNSTTVEVWVEASNFGSRLRPGETVKVSIVVETISDATVVPAISLLTASDGTTSVMVIGSDGRAHQKKVDVGIRQGDEMQIKQGIEPGEKVVTTGAYGLRDNARTQIEEAKAAPGESGGKDSAPDAGKSK
jgi:HlyD family secretion protein